MATYAIGDVQGCYDELLRLLEQIRFDPAEDRLWFTGDLVNRGPKSLETLRFVKGLGDRAITVLGNHDLHLIAVAAEQWTAGHEDTLQSIMAAPDRDELVAWLRHRPLFHHDPQLGFSLLHAGLPPQWDLSEAQARAHEVEQTLRGSRWHDLVWHMYGNEPHQWREELTGWERLRFIINCFTRLRYCDEQGGLALTLKGPPGGQSPGYRPWFQCPGRASAGERIVFGHWSTLGPWSDGEVFCIDTGCLWGYNLTALRLAEEPAWTEWPCPGAMTPAGTESV